MAAGHALTTARNSMKLYWTSESETRGSHSIARFVLRFKWHCRRGGGLYLGLRLQFPTSVLYSVLYMNDEVRSTWHLSIGLLVATLECEYRVPSRVLPSWKAKAKPTMTADGGASSQNDPRSETCAVQAPDRRGGVR